jgi:hypothetical protein
MVMEDTSIGSAVLSSEDRAILDKLRNELIGIHYRWKVVQEVCLVSGDNLRVAQSFAPNLFQIMQRALADELMVSLARFTDNEKSVAGRRNVVLLTGVKRFLKASEHPRAMNRVRSFGVKAKVHDVRHRTLVHSDYDLFVSGKPLRPLKAVQFAEVRRFIEAITDVMKMIDREVGEGVLLYEEGLRLGTWETIFDGLRDAEKFRELVDHAWSGQPTAAADILSLAGHRVVSSVKGDASAAP